LDYAGGYGPYWVRFSLALALEEGIMSDKIWSFCNWWVITAWICTVTYIVAKFLLWVVGK
jgi:hypothetical protein